MTRVWIKKDISIDPQRIVDVDVGRPAGQDDVEAPVFDLRPVLRTHIRQTGIDTCKC